MVRIRMKSFGRRHRPFFRICAMDVRTPRDGRAIEELGWYDPMVRNPEAREWLDTPRVRYWLSVGAQPSEKVAIILKRHGITKPGPGEPWDDVPTPERPSHGARTTTSVVTGPKPKPAPTPEPAPEEATPSAEGTEGEATTETPAPESEAKPEESTE